MNLKNLVKNIKKKGHEEEFSNFEINLLAMEVSDSLSPKGS